MSSHDSQPTTPSPSRKRKSSSGEEKEEEATSSEDRWPPLTGLTEEQVTELESKCRQVEVSVLLTPLSDDALKTLLQSDRSLISADEQLDAAT